MKLPRLAAACGIVTCVSLTLSVGGQAQGRRGGSVTGGVQGGRVGPPPPAQPGVQVVADDPFAGPVVTNAPFSADADTRVTQILGDGTRIEQSATARFYRDSAGRVRREQSILGLAALSASNEPRTVITIVADPEDAFAYTLDPLNRTARRVPRAADAYMMVVSNLTLSWTASDQLNLPLGVEVGLSYFRTDRDGRNRNRWIAGQTPASPPVEESLGTRQIEGVSATGRKTTITIPTGQIGNDRPIAITDERWESPELRLLLRSLHHDPRTGDIEYRLTNIRREEPPPELFMIPPDYTTLDTGVRTGGPGTRGGQPGAGSGRGQ